MKLIKENSVLFIRIIDNIYIFLFNYTIGNFVLNLIHFDVLNLTAQTAYSNFCINLR